MILPRGSTHCNPALGSVLFFSRPRSEGWPHHGRTFSIYSSYRGTTRQTSTVGSRAFAVAAQRIWNTLPTDVVAANSLSASRRLLKCFLFRQSYHDIVY